MDPDPSCSRPMLPVLLTLVGSAGGPPPDNGDALAPSLLLLPLTLAVLMPTVNCLLETTEPAIVLLSLSAEAEIEPALLAVDEDADRR